MSSTDSFPLADALWEEADQTGLERRTWLVQRLRQPEKFTNPFAFGGGLRNGGLSDEAMGLLGGVFSFDYMGSAEFEFGALPKALQAMAERGESLISATALVDLSTVDPGWTSKGKKAKKVKGTVPVHVLCSDYHLKAVAEKVQELACRDHTLKGSTGFPSALISGQAEEGDDHRFGRTAGWLEIDNGFFFFTDETMWRRTCEIFSVRTP